MGAKLDKALNLLVWSLWAWYFGILTGILIVLWLTLP